MKITVSNIEDFKKANLDFLEGIAPTPPWDINEKFKFICHEFFDKKNDSLTKRQFLNKLMGNDK